MQEGPLEVVNALLRQDGIDVNQAKKDGWTPPHIACRYRQTEIIEILLSKPGINANQRNRGGWTPLHIACSDGHYDGIHAY